MFSVAKSLLPLVLLCQLITRINGQNLLLSNDDGWATSEERATFNALEDAGYNMLLSCPADDRSGTGSSTTTPGPRTSPCQYNSCPANSPPEGSDVNDPRLNWVNGYPVDSARYGIQTLSPKFYGGPPDLVVSGPNIGSNAGSTVLISGTVGAAVESVLEGVPAISFSGPSGSHVSYTTLETDPDSASTRTALIYSKLVVKVVDALVTNNPKPYLPSGFSLNVNFPSSSQCPDAEAVKFVFARINEASSSAGPDVETCGTTRLPTENATYQRKDACYASVSVMKATDKGDVDAETQKVVLDKLGDFLTCLPASETKCPGRKCK